MEGMKTIYDALHPDVEGEPIPTFLYPFRAGNFFKNTLRRSNGYVARGSDGRQ